jgi:fatty-acyl-CoA synthase
MNSAPHFPEGYDAIRWWAGTAPRRTALVDTTHARRCSYADLDALADRWASWLQENGVQRGSRVAVLAPNCVATVALFFAATRLGAALVPLNWRLAPGELQAVIDDARPLVALRYPLLDAPPAGCCSITWHVLDAASYEPPQGTPSQQFNRAGPLSEYAPVPHAAAAEDAALILYTSGTTGRPKGVVIPHRQILFNAVATCTAWELGPDDVAPVTTPFFHTGGWNVLATPLWHCGGTVVLSKRFDADTFLALLAAERCTVALTVPTQLVMLLAAPDWGRPLPALRRFFSGGASCPAAVADAVRSAGYTLREGYGLTECGPNCFVISDREAARHPGAVGRPIPFLRMRLCDDAGVDVPAGDVGELWLRGPQMFAGYFGDVTHTREVVTPDGWLRTGDLAQRDADGLFSIRGRRREMYISGGENVFPGEVEAVIASCPGVAEAVVVGVAHQRWGEVGRAFVVIRDPGLSAEAITQWTRGRLAGYKVPHHIALLPELPRLGSGKVDRRALLQMTILEEA